MLLRIKCMIVKKLVDFLRYSNKNALHNPFQFIIYLAAYPVAIFFKSIRFSPNQVTLLSVLFSVFSFISLINYNLHLFYTFFGMSYILDYADGTLARLTNKEGKSALNVDHISDQLKIIMTFLGFGFYYDCKEIWALTFLSSALFLFYSLLNHELSNNLKLSMFGSSYDSEENKIENNSRLKLLKRYLLRNYAILRYFYTFIFGTLYLIDGHTLIIFFFIPISYEYAVYLLIYFISICSIHSYHRACSLSRLSKF